MEISARLRGQHPPIPPLSPANFPEHLSTEIAGCEFRKQGIYNFYKSLTKAETFFLKLF